MSKNTDHTDNTFTRRHLAIYLKEKGLTRSTLKEFSVPDGVTKIIQEAFRGCTSLTSIELPSSLSTIGVAAFYNCTSLSSIRLSEGLLTIGQEAFRGCTSLSSIRLSEGLITIEQGAFYDCTSLSSIKLPEGLTKIGQQAFDNCTSLTSIELPSSLSEIGLCAFDGCNNLKYIVTNKSFDWRRKGIETSNTLILSYSQYLERKHASLLENTDINNPEPDEAYIIYRIFNDKDYLPTWDTLKDTFQNRSTTQLRSLLQKLGKDMNSIDDVIPSIGITINNSPLHDSIFSYMSIKDCDGIFDGSKNLDFIWQTEIKDPKDDLSEIESEQNLVESDNSTTKTHIN